MSIVHIHFFRAIMATTKTTNSFYLTMSSASGLRCTEKELTGSEIGIRAGTVVILTGSSATTHGVTSSLEY